MKMFDVQEVYKSFNQTKALKGVTFQIHEGSFVGLLGENGAGKSTLLNMITSNLNPDQGNIYYCGELVLKSKTIKKDLGIVYQNSILDKKLSVEENLLVRGSLYGLSKEEMKKRIKELSKEFGLDSILKQHYGTLSGGQRRKVDIARALIHQPKVLILDEPTTGLDPDIRKTLWENIANLRKKSNMTILLTTHYMEETESCDYIVMLDKGEIIKEGTPNELKVMFSSKRLVLYTNEIQQLEKLLQTKKLEYSVVKDKIIVLIKDSFYALDFISSCKDLVTSFEVINGTMDDMFLKIKKEGK